MAIKNAVEPQCWKWWSFDHHEYWTVDTTDVIPILVRLRQSKTDDEIQDHGRWVTEAIADGVYTDRLNDVSIQTLLRVDKLFGSDFSKNHKDHYDNNKQKRDSKMKMKREYMESGAVGLVNCITEALEDTDGGVFDNLTEEEKALVDSVVNDCFSFYVDNKLDEEAEDKDEKVLSFLEEFDSKQEINDYIVEEEEKLKKIELMVQQVAVLDSNGIGSSEGAFSSTARSLQSDLARGRQWIADIKRLSV